MAVPANYFSWEPIPIRDNVLLFPAVSIDTYDRPPHTVLQSVFDRLWNAVGWERSISYDDKGNWVRHR